MSMFVALLYTQTMLLAAPAVVTPAPGGGPDLSGELRVQGGWCADPHFAGPWYCLARCTEATQFYVADENPLDISAETDWDAARADCYLKAVDFCKTAFSQYLDRSCLGGAFDE
ncbi:hypothetical protein [Nannocystis punicea]|uniref:Secreted protein n=1 Tax=Nannocystis punicea TaxID=2995304 RepID=A0ABY7H5P6_9BACT|nr:hypothetical protein [Nannocystis poenicansa]WAS94606.1 hypothetical protein O0S08_00465 [Nannocystis poenicansa]